MPILLEKITKNKAEWQMLFQQPIKYEDLKVTFLTETKCKIRFIYVRFNCKRKKQDGNSCH